MKRIVFLLLVVVVLAGCKSSKHLATSEKNVQVSSYLTSKLQLTIPGKRGKYVCWGTMKMKTHERVQISLLMPILRTEVARVEVTPDGVLLVDRMNKRFVRATKDELKGHAAEECRIFPSGEDIVGCLFARWEDGIVRKRYRHSFVGKG